MKDDSKFFPRVIEDTKLQVVEHHDVLTRHGRAIYAQASNIAQLNERLNKIERSDPIKELSAIEDRFAEKLATIDREVIKLRTAIYVAAIIIGGGTAGAKGVEIARGEKPAVIQLAPDAIEALRSHP